MTSRREVPMSTRKMIQYYHLLPWRFRRESTAHNQAYKLLICALELESRSELRGLGQLKNIKPRH